MEPLFKVFPFNASAPWFGFLPGTGPQAPADARAHSPRGLTQPADAPGQADEPLDHFSVAFKGRGPAAASKPPPTGFQWYRRDTVRLAGFFLPAQGQGWAGTDGRRSAPSLARPRPAALPGRDPAAGGPPLREPMRRSLRRAPGPLDQGPLPLGRRTAMPIDGRKGEQALSSRPAADAFRQWAEQVGRKLEGLRRQSSWLPLAEMGEKALHWAMAHIPPARAHGAPLDAAGAFAVLFARYRAIALLKMGDDLWRRGELDKAVAVYHRVLTGTPIAWEGDGSPRVPGPAAGTPVPPAAEYQVQAAGLRLALWGSVRGGAEGVELAATLPRRVAAVLARLERTDQALAGEGLSRATVKAAVLIDRFLQDAGIAGEYRGDVHALLRDGGGSAPWEGPASSPLGRPVAQNRLSLYDWMAYSALALRDTPLAVVLHSALGPWLCRRLAQAAAPWLAASALAGGVAAWLAHQLLR